VQLFAPPPLHRHQVRRLEQRKMLGHTLPGHAHVLAEFIQGLAVVGVQTVQELPPPRIRQRLEQRILIAHGENIRK